MKQKEPNIIGVTYNMQLEPVNIICPICGNGNYMRHMYGANVGRLDVKCINCNAYFNFAELSQHIVGNTPAVPMSNADRIRTMTDEEMAKVYFDKFFRTTPYCVKEACYDDDDCEECSLDWLKKECDT